MPDGEPIRSIDDLLTPAEQRQLTEDLRAIAECRRRAEAEAALIVIGGVG